MKKSILFHVPYSFGNLESGSRVRPFKMHAAFLNLGYDVDMISGNVRERHIALKKVRRKNKTYAFCYSEPASYPVHPFLDYSIYLYLRQRHVPIGIYYRDAYWKFADYFNKKGVKRLELSLRYRSDLCLYKHAASVLFFPTSSLADLFTVRIPKIILPPGGEERVCEEKTLTQPVRGIYVGGITHRYGFDLLLKAFELLNQHHPILLEVICRKDELALVPRGMRSLLKVPWLNIHHVSGERIAELYRTSDFGVIPLYRDAYNNLAMPVKLFEYLSYRLPVIATHCNEMSRFVNENNCGLVCKDTPESLAESIETLITAPGLYDRLSEGASQAIHAGNSWDDRAATVASTLCGKESS